MFLFKKAKSSSLLAPVSGKYKPLKDVPDPVFASGTMGQGFAIEPSEEGVYAPVSGKITTLFPGGHAIGITARDGAEVLVHIGVDTVKLKGKPFKACVSENAQVEAGELLTRVDFNAIRGAGCASDVIVVLTSGEKCTLPEGFEGERLRGGKSVALLYKK